MVITKSISRFARNTVDCLKYVRMLKDKNIPVYFEKEAINSMDARGEVMLTIMASLAQQESESLSQNVKIGMQYRFQQGRVMVNCACFLGYDKDSEGNLVINPEQAEIVKRIFLEYLEGSSCRKIAKGLEHDGILTARGNTRWHDSSVRLILENEKYMGDALLQKTYTTDFLQKKRVKNNGIMPQYYVEGSHPAIIPKDLFMKVQEEIARRSIKRDQNGKKVGHSSNTCFTHLIYCAECNEPYRRVHWNNNGKKSVVWRCTSRLDKKGVCHARTLDEEILKSAFIESLNKMWRGKTEYIQKLKENLDSILKTCDKDMVERIDMRLNELQKTLIDKAGKHENYSEIAEEILSLKEEKKNAMMDASSRNEYIARIKDLQNFIKNQPDSVTKFDETLVRHLTEKITVFEQHIIFEFRSGIKVEVNM